MNIRGWYVDSKIKKIKAPIGDENGNQIENKSKRRKIKKIKAPIGDENATHWAFYHLLSFIKKIKAPIGDENDHPQIDNSALLY